MKKVEVFAEDFAFRVNEAGQGFAYAKSHDWLGVNDIGRPYAVKVVGKGYFPETMVLVGILDSEEKANPERFLFATERVLLSEPNKADCFKFAVDVAAYARKMHELKEEARIVMGLNA